MVQLTMPAERSLPSAEAQENLRMARDIAAEEFAPKAAEAEANGAFPREVFEHWVDWGC